MAAPVINRPTFVCHQIGLDSNCHQVCVDLRKITLSRLGVKPFSMCLVPNNPRMGNHYNRLPTSIAPHFVPLVSNAYELLSVSEKFPFVSQWCFFQDPLWSCWCLWTKGAHIIKDVLCLFSVHLIYCNKRLNLGSFPLLYALPDDNWKLINTCENERRIVSKDAYVIGYKPL